MYNFQKEKKRRVFQQPRAFTLSFIVFQKKLKFRGFRIYSLSKIFYMQVPRNFQQSPIFKFGVQHLSNKKVDNMDWQLLIKIDDHRHRKNKRVGYAFEAINKESIWIGLNLTSAFCLVFSFFFFFWFQPHYLTKSTMNSARMYYSQVLQIPLFSHFFIKNGSYGTIHIFKNYFATVFSVSTKISSIQTEKTRSFWDAIAMAKAHQPQQFRKL